MFLFLNLAHRIKVLLTVGLTVSVISGCGSLRLQTVEHTIQNESSYNPVTQDVSADDRLQLAPLTPDNIKTFPVSEVYDETGISLPDATKAFDLIGITITDESIEIVQDSVLSVYKLPVKGETLSIRNIEDHLQGYLAGQPEEETIEVTIPDKRNLFEEVRLTLKWLVIVALLGLLGFAGFTLYKAKKAKLITKSLTDVATRTLLELTRKFPKR